MENYEKLTNPIEHHHSDQSPITIPQQSGGGRLSRLRLRAVETEQEFFFKVLNISTLRKLLLIQASCSTAIVFFQVINKLNYIVN
jgi:hypothetical protein